MSIKNREVGIVIEGRDGAALTLGLVMHLREVVAQLPKNIGLTFSEQTRPVVLEALVRYQATLETALRDHPDADALHRQNIKLRSELRGRIDEIDALHNRPKKPAEEIAPVPEKEGV